MQPMELVFGGGWGGSVRAGIASGVANLGRSCPIHYNRHWYLQILGKQFRRNSLFPNQIRDVNPDMWGLESPGCNFPNIQGTLISERLPAQNNNRRFRRHVRCAGRPLWHNCNT